jgi:hypothetical protein
MNLAWYDLNKNTFNNRMKVVTLDRQILELVKDLSGNSITSDEMSADSYYYKNGFGNKTLKDIEYEFKQKFPDYPFKKATKVKDNELLISSFFRERLFFNKNDYRYVPLEFNGCKVEGIWSRSPRIFIIKYLDSDHFITSVVYGKDRGLKSAIFAKGYPMDNPGKLLSELRLMRENPKKYSKVSSAGSGDTFHIPLINLEPYLRLYNELRGSEILDQSSIEAHKHKIGLMYEDLAFDMKYDNNTEAIKSMPSGYLNSRTPLKVSKNPKKLIYDKPFWIILSNVKLDRPYFMLNVRNTAIMKIKQ